MDKDVSSAMNDTPVRGIKSIRPVVPIPGSSLPGLSLILNIIPSLLEIVPSPLPVHAFVFSILIVVKLSYSIGNVVIHLLYSTFSTSLQKFHPQST